MKLALIHVLTLSLPLALIGCSSAPNQAPERSAASNPLGRGAALQRDRELKFAITEYREARLELDAGRHAAAMQRAGRAIQRLCDESSQGLDENRVWALRQLGTIAEECGNTPYVNRCTERIEYTLAYPGVAWISTRAVPFHRAPSAIPFRSLPRGPETDEVVKELGLDPEEVGLPPSPVVEVGTAREQPVVEAGGATSLAPQADSNRAAAGLDSAADAETLEQAEVQIVRGEFDAARDRIERFRASRSRAESSYGDDLDLRAAELLALIHFLRGELDEAERAYADLEVERTRRSSTTQEDMELVWEHLGWVLVAQGKFGEAEEVQSKLVESRATSTSDELRDRARRDLLATLHALGELDRAEELEQKRISAPDAGLRVAQESGDWSRTADPRIALALAWWDLGRREDARTLMRAVLTDSPPREGAADDDALRWKRLRLAGMELALNDHETARNLYQIVIEGDARTAPATGPDREEALEGLARALQRLGEDESARMKMRELLVERNRRLPPGHPARERDHELLAAMEAAAAAEAGAADEGGKPQVGSSAGRDSSATTAVLGRDRRAEERRAFELQAGCRMDDALAARLRIVEEDQRTLPIGDPESVESLRELAALYRVRGETAAARRIENSIMGLSAAGDLAPESDRPIEAAAPRRNWAVSGPHTKNTTPEFVPDSRFEFTAKVESPAGVARVQIRQDGVLLDEVWVRNGLTFAPDGKSAELRLRLRMSDHLPATVVIVSAEDYDGRSGRSEPIVVRRAAR